MAWVIEGAAGWPFDAIVIAVIVVLNAVLGYVQQAKAEHAVEALQRMTATTATVVRDGVQLRLPTHEPRFWMSHLWGLRRVRRCDGLVLVLNTLFPLSVAFLPFPIAVLAEYVHYRSAMVVYAVSVSIAGLLFTLLWALLSYRSELLNEISTRRGRRLLLRFFSVSAVSSPPFRSSSRTSGTQRLQCGSFCLR